jgi:hypothetical protein
MVDEAAIRLRWDTVDSGLDERGRRLFAAAEARSAGRGGLAIISKITGLARSTISRGKKDLDGHPLPKGRVRPCRGRASCALRDRSGLVPALKRLVEPATLVGSFSPSATRSAAIAWLVCRAVGGSMQHAPARVQTARIAIHWCLPAI